MAYVEYVLDVRDSGDAVYRRAGRCGESYVTKARGAAN